MKKLIFIALATLFITNNVHAQNKKAAEYNNKLFKLQNEVSKQIINFFEIVKTGDITKINQSHNTVNKTLDDIIAKVSKFKSFEGDNSLKDGVITWIKSYEESFENEYKLMLPLLNKKDRTESENQQLNKMHDDLIAEEKVFDQKLADIQKSFAEKHQLTLGDGN